MKIRHNGETVSISGIAELGASNSRSFAATLSAALPLDVGQIEIDLSETGFLDCGGVGALIALRNCARRRNGKVIIRLLNPTPPVRHIFKLTHMDRIFPIERR